MKAFRPFARPPERVADYGDQEHRRRAKWLYRKRCANPWTKLTIHDAPPRQLTRGASLERDWLDPCPSCGKYQWDLDEHTAQRICAFCAGVTLPVKERKLCYQLRRQKA